MGTDRFKGRFEETKGKLKEYFGISLDSRKPGIEGMLSKSRKKGLVAYGNVKVDIKKASLGE